MKVYTNDGYIKAGRSIGIFKSEQNEAEPPHRHEFIELVYILSGSAVEMVDEQEYAVRRGDMIFINYGSVHAFTDPENFRYCNICFSPEVVSDSIITPDNAFALLSLTAFDEMRKEQNGGRMTFSGKERLEIENILSVGITVHTGVNIGTDAAFNEDVDITFEELRASYDAIYIAIGAQTDKKTGMEGEDSKNVMSAVEMLGRIGDDDMPDFTGKKVVVIGGGNVAMDVTRSAVRLGAEKVSCVYRRRQVDMTALPEEVEGALAEGVEMLTLQAPVRIEADENGNAVALWTQPQVIGPMDKAYRPRPMKAEQPENRIEADLIVLAIGQGVETHGFEQMGIKINRGSIAAQEDSGLPTGDGIFAGGDCVTGPATAIRAIAAGKVAAANIDEYLGFNHEITADVEVPTPRFNNKPPHGRVNLLEREAGERKKDFGCIECEMTDQEAKIESTRCLRCDYFGYGNFKGGRNEKW